MKRALVDAGVPSARYATFDASQQDEAIAYLRDLSGLYVVKTDGLAAGKGVFVTESLTDAVDDVRSKLSGSSFGDAGRRVVIEEGLVGPELSLLCLCDGDRVLPLAPAQDYKRVGDGDQGPNTGGMGAYSPVPRVDQREVASIVDTIVEPTVAWLRKNDIDYRGVLYAGLMLTADGPKVIEYNVRFGDPEAQVVLPRITTDLAGLLVEVARGQLVSEPSFTSDAIVTVMMCTEGYPNAPRPGDHIEGLDEAQAMEGVKVYCAGVARDASARLTTAGGRVLSVTGRAPDLPRAREAAYRGVDVLHWPGAVLRRDIASSPLGL
jgi:phosphoribosylamine--glycine ligase